MVILNVVFVPDLTAIVVCSFINWSYCSRLVTNFKVLLLQIDFLWTDTFHNAAECTCRQYCVYKSLQSASQNAEIQVILPIAPPKY